MVTKLRLVFSITIVFFSFYASGQSKYWEKVSASNFKSRSSLRQLKVEKGAVFSFQENDFKQNLINVSSAKSVSRIVYLPDSLGKAVAYEVKEASVLAPELARKYPDIKSFKGVAIDNPSDQLYLSISHKDIQATIVHNDERPNQFLQKQVKIAMPSTLERPETTMTLILFVVLKTKFRLIQRT